MKTEFKIVDGVSVARDCGVNKAIPPIDVWLEVDHDNDLCVMYLEDGEPTVWGHFSDEHGEWLTASIPDCIA